MNNVNKILESKDKELEKLRETAQKDDKYKQRLIENLEREKTQSERRYEQRLDEQCEKY